MAVKPILGMVPPDPASLAPSDLAGLLKLGGHFRSLGAERFHALLQADDDEQRGLPGRVVRVRSAQGDQVGERHHRDLPGAALARLGVRAAAPLHGRDRRRVPGLGIPEGRHRRDQQHHRERGARVRRRDPHRRGGGAGASSRTAARPAWRCRAARRSPRRWWCRASIRAARSRSWSIAKELPDDLRRRRPAATSSAARRAR